MRRFSLLLGGVIVLVAIAYGYSRLNTVQTAASYRLETVERGAIEKTISVSYTHLTLPTICSV